MLSVARSSVLALGAALVVGAAAGCVSSDVTGTGTASAVAGVRVVQVMGDAGSGVDFSLNGQTAATGLAFGVIAPNPAQQQYALISPASPFAFNATGVTTAFFSNPGGAFAANTGYLLVAYGRVTRGVSPAGTVAVLADTGTTATTSALVRVFDAIDYVKANTGTAADVYIYPQGTTRPTVPTFAAVAYGARSAYAGVAPGTAQVDIFDAAGAHTVPLFTTTLTLTAGSIRTLLLSDPAPTATTGSAGAVVTLNDAG